MEAAVLAAEAHCRLVLACYIIRQPRWWDSTPLCVIINFNTLGVVIGMASFLVVFSGRFWKDFRASHLFEVESIIIVVLQGFVLVERCTSTLICEVIF